MKVVVDTNVFISSFLNPNGTPREIINLWKTGRINLCICSEILTEYVDVLLRFGLEGEAELRELLDLIKQRANISFVIIENDLDLIRDDPADNKFIECAVRAGASHIISGDKHLLKFKQYEDIVITTPADFPGISF
jgi:uncharacterized protein